MDSWQQFVDRLVENGVLKTPKIISAFKKIKRHDFLPSSSKVFATQDIPIGIGYGQTNSQPTTVAILLEMLEPQPGNNVLDIGSGSGWTTALLAEIVGRNGRVIGLERIKGLVEFGRKNLSKYKFKNAKIRKAKKHLGYKTKKFDRILVSAASDELPKELIKQIKKEGTLVIPVRNSVLKITKDNKGKIKIGKRYGFAFVPLITN